MTVDWKKVAGRMRAELDRAALNERPRRVLVALIRLTLMQRRAVVVLPDRDVLCGVVGIGKTHMAEVWERIEGTRVATFRKVELGWECVVNADSSQWAVEWAWSRDSWTRFAEFIERVPGQAQGSLLEPDPSITKTMAELAAEAAAGEGREARGESYQNGNWKPPSVTKLVTGQREPGRTVPVNSSTVSPALYKADKAGELLNRGDKETEAALFGNLKRILESSPFESDRQDLAAWGGHWRVKHIRPDPDKFAAALRIVRSEIAGGAEAKKSRAAWIKDLLKR